MDALLELLARLDEVGIHHHLSQFRTETICVHAAIPGERWEIELFADGRIEVERFVSGGDIEGEDAVERLLREAAE